MKLGSALKEGIEEIIHTSDSFCEANQTLITVVNTTVQMEVKQKNPNDEVLDKKKDHFTLDVSVHKFCEELFLENQKTSNEDKPFNENKIDNNCEKVIIEEKTNNNVKKSIELKNLKTDFQSKKIKKNRIFNFFTKTQNSKNIKSSHESTRKTEKNYEMHIQNNQTANSNSLKLIDIHLNDRNTITEVELLDNHQKLLIIEMKNKCKEIIMEKLNEENFSTKENESLLKTFVSRSIDLLRCNKVKCFEELCEILKKEYNTLKEDVIIDKLINRLEDYLIKYQIFKNLELQKEKYDIINFPCDHVASISIENKNPQDKKENDFNIYVQNCSTDFKDNNKLDEHNTKHSWALGLDSPPNIVLMKSKEIIIFHFI